MRIVIADDHDIVRQGLRDLLRAHAGWEVCGEARSGLEALDLVRQLRPDVAIVDLSMPLLNGLELTRRIRSEVPGVEVILYSVHHSEELASQALDAGARGYVLKSQPLGDLILALESVAAQARTGAARTGASRRPAEGRKLRPALTPRQREIVQLVAEGKSNKEIAQMLGISVRTIETHRAHVMQHLGLRSVVQVVRYAVRNHIVEA